MKIKFVFFVFCISISLFASSQKIVSLNSLFTEQNAILIPGVEGLWGITGLDMPVSINKAGDNFYFLKYGNDKNSALFEAAFVKVGDEIFIDLNGVKPDTHKDHYRSSFITSHSFYKVRMIKDTLQLFELNYSWFYNYAAKKQLPLKYEWIDNAMLLTCSTSELNSFLSEHSSEIDFFSVYATLVNKHKNIVEKRVVSEVSPGSNSSTVISQNCKPEFPLQNGWLGADGDVSVPFNATTTLFIFSDTYVGNRNQQNRKEPDIKLVSNSVAVETCLPDGRVDVKYFWNKMYSENPEPIFKTATSRYKFWVNDAFLVENNLYVLLEKVGHKPGASSDDIFGFSLIGFTLARITNPFELPDKWKIELIPLPDFVNPYMGIRSHVIKDGFVYFFVSRNDNAQLLVRKRTDFIEDPEKPFEYYAVNKIWKAGIKREDMDTIFSGFKGTTVNYHPDMRKWVMLSDIKFMDNKIKIRTASALEGPWSDEITVYECPEVTIGSPSYSKSNFCYLPRECIQNYDAKKQEMLITYDINNSDFSEINANSQIYTPKIISVSLKKTLGNR